MNRFRVVFRKSKWGDGEKIDNVIDIWTAFVNLPYVIWKERFNFKNVWRFLKMNYAHVEIWTPSDCGLIKPRPCDWWNGNMATSTTRDGYDGTVMRPVKDVIKDYGRWEFVEYEVNGIDYRRAQAYAASEVLNNKGYSNEDIGKMVPVVRHFVNDPDRNICSEFSHNYMVKAHCWIIKKFRVLSPRKLAYRIWKQHNQIFQTVRRNA